MTEGNGFICKDLHVLRSGLYNAKTRKVESAQCFQEAALSIPMTPFSFLQS